MLVRWIFLLTVILAIRPSQEWFPKILWTYHEAALQKTDHSLLIFKQHHKRILGEQWQIRFLNPENIQEWLDKYPDLDNALKSSQFKNVETIRRVNLAKFVLLNNFGGIYIELTTILLENFDWLNNLKNINQVNNKYGQNPQVFLLEHKKFSQKFQYYDLQTQSIMYTVPSIETYFIAARPKTKLLTEFIQYYKQGILVKMPQQQNGENKNYFLEQSLIKGYSLGHLEPLSNTQIEIHFALLSIIHKKQIQFDKNSQANKQGPRNLAVKHYKLWTLPTEVSAQRLNQIKDGHHSTALTPLTPVNIVMNSEIQYFNEAGLYPKYFIRFSRQNMNYFTKYFLRIKLRCQDDMYILKDSICYQFLLKDYPIKFYENNILEYSFNRNCQLPQYYAYLKRKVMKLLKQNKPINAVQMYQITKPELLQSIQKAQNMLKTLIIVGLGLVAILGKVIISLNSKMKKIDQAKISSK